MEFVKARQEVQNPDEKEIRLLELAEDPSGKYLGLPHRVKTWYKDASQLVETTCVPPRAEQKSRRGPAESQASAMYLATSVSLLQL
uniref:Uncharacterized protein n=1 Tax=Haemonchus contortus TaxID=6289 RepID=A0A7I5EAT2_HAECO